MIAYLKGVVLQKGPTYIILEQHGVGYKIFVTPDILESEIGENIALYIHHKVAEDDESLYGVSDFTTLQFMEQLLTVSGVGPKVALAILSAAKADAVKQAILAQDAGMFTRVSGVGLKTAEKIIVELKNKIGALEAAVAGGAGSSEVFDALLALGYSQREVRDILSSVDQSLPVQEQVKQALRLAGKK